MILIQSEEVDADNRCSLSGQRARHMREVLKVGVGQILRIGLMNGPLGSGTVKAVDTDRVVLHCQFEHEPPPKPCIDLLLAMPRPKVMKRLWAQLAALGVGRIVLLRADKVEKYYFDSHVLEPEFYRERLVEGLQQARCTHLPEVIIRPRFKPFVEDELDRLFGMHLKLLSDPSGKQSLGETLLQHGGAERIVVAIGPEGGWTSYERTLFEDHGFQLVGLGPRILRSDTAVVGLLSIVHGFLQCRDD